MKDGPSMEFPGTDDLCGDYCHGLHIVSPGSFLLICSPLVLRAVQASHLVISILFSSTNLSYISRKTVTVFIY